MVVDCMGKTLDELRLLRKAALEVSGFLKDDPESPVSLSLFLLRLGIRDAGVEDKLIKKTAEIASGADDPMELTVEDFQHEFHKIASQISDAPDETEQTIYIVTWIGQHLFPRVYPIAMNF